MAVLGDCPIPYRVGACSLLYQDGAQPSEKETGKTQTGWYLGPESQRKWAERYMADTLVAKAEA